MQSAPTQGGGEASRAPIVESGPHRQSQRRERDRQDRSNAVTSRTSGDCSGDKRRVSNRAHVVGPDASSPLGDLMESNLRNALRANEGRGHMNRRIRFRSERIRRSSLEGASGGRVGTVLTDDMPFEVPRNVATDLSRRETR